MLTLRNRLALVNVLVFLITFAVLVGVLASQLLGHLYEQLDQELVRAGNRALSHVSMVAGVVRMTDEDGRLTAELGPDSFVRLLDSHGAIIGGSGKFQGLAVASDALAAAEAGVVFNQRSESGQLLRVYTQPIYATIGPTQTVKAGYVQAAAVPDEILETIEQIRSSLLVATPLALLVAGLAGFWAASKALQPLTTMTHSAAAISADSLTERRLPIPRAKDELQALAVAFNATLERLAAAFTRQQRLTADASHELRTPVAAILGQAELALSRPRTPEAYQETLRRIQSEAERMQRLIGRMLTLARAESGQQVLVFAATDVADLLRTLTETFAPQGAAKAIVLRLHTPPSVVVVTDADSLTQILLNLLENAIAYTDQGAIDITLAFEGDAARIQISDSGPGIDPESVRLIFQPFYRADPSRQRQNGGVGLGLALVYELTHLLGGHIEVHNRPEGGAVFTLTLPHHPPAAADTPSA